MSTENPYESIMGEANKPFKDREKCLKTRKGNMIRPRRHSLTEEKLAIFKEEEKKTGKFPNPYRKNGRYYAFIAALVELGVNEVHSYGAVKAQMKEILSQHTTCRGVDGWTDFESPKTRNKLVSKDLRGRIVQNAHVLQRLTDANPYGFKLAQLGGCIDVLKDENNLPTFRLRTGLGDVISEIIPINEMKKRKRAKAKA